MVWRCATDLTLISRAKKPEYLYTYLRTFYQDDSRPYGVNNLVYPNVGMPHVFSNFRDYRSALTLTKARG